MNNQKPLHVCVLDKIGTFIDSDKVVRLLKGMPRSSRVPHLAILTVFDTTVPSYYNDKTDITI